MTDGEAKKMADGEAMKVRRTPSAKPTDIGEMIDDVASEDIDNTVIMTGTREAMEGVTTTEMKTSELK